MILTPENSTNPAFWGKEFTFVVTNGIKIYTQLQTQQNQILPNEFYFDQRFLNYRWVYGLSLFERIN